MLAGLSPGGQPAVSVGSCSLAAGREAYSLPIALECKVSTASLKAEF